MVRSGFAKRTLCVASRNSRIPVSLCILSMALAALAGLTLFEAAASASKEETVPLPPPEASGKPQLEESEEAAPLPGDPQESSHGETKSDADRHGPAMQGATSSSAAEEHGQEQEESGAEALVQGTPPAESSSPMAGLIWFGAVFLVLVCVIYLFL